MGDRLGLATPGHVQAVRAVGGLIHNDHPDPIQWPEEFDYTPASAAVIVNSEIWPDTVQVASRRFTANTERTLRQYLGAGGRTGFVGGSDTHEGKPAESGKEQDGARARASHRG